MAKRSVSQPRQRYDKTRHVAAAAGDMAKRGTTAAVRQRYDKTQRVAAAAGGLIKRSAPAAVQHETEKPHRRRALTFRFLFFIQTKVRFFVKKVQFFCKAAQQ